MDNLNAHVEKENLLKIKTGIVFVTKECRRLEFLLYEQRVSKESREKDDEKIKKSAHQKLLDLLRRAQLLKVMGSSDGNMGPGVVFETGLTGVCIKNRFEKFGQMEVL